MRHKCKRQGKHWVGHKEDLTHMMGTNPWRLTVLLVAIFVDALIGASSRSFGLRPASLTIRTHPGGFSGIVGCSLAIVFVLNWLVCNPASVSALAIRLSPVRTSPPAFKMHAQPHHTRPRDQSGQNSCLAGAGRPKIVHSKFCSKNISD